MKILSKLKNLLILLLFLSQYSFAQVEMVYTQLEEYPHGVKNPMKGFGIDTIQGNHPLATVVKTYIPWNVIEDDPEDDVQKIIDYCNIRWRETGTYKNVPAFSPDKKDVSEFHGMIPANYNPGDLRGCEDVNVRIVPRVYLQYAPKGSYSHFDKYTESIDQELAFPEGMKKYDFFTNNYCERVEKLAAKLAEAWDNDPRVIHVEMGIIGLWGEQHTPYPTEEVQRCMGNAFANAFKNKHVLHRWSHHFQDYDFGIYADSWGHDQDRGYDVALLGDKWKTKPITGEVAYNWGNAHIQPGAAPDSTVLLDRHRKHLIESIRTLHCSYLFWLGRYDWRNPAIQKGADELQKAFGYRYVIDTIGFTPTLKNDHLGIYFEVTNTASAPFYYQFLMEVALLDRQTKEKVWGTILEDVDIRQWQPGNFWNPNFNQYMEAPKEHKIEAQLKINSSLKTGDYILAISILDPHAQKPAIRFANKNYINGGYCPFGIVSVGKTNADWKINFDFDDINADNSINYQYDN
ncbi:MAG: DUF4832 domain-containing protein [Bacteroidota bacterium]